MGQHICLNSAKSFVGKNVNLHLVDGSVVINVFLKAISEKRFLVIKVAGKTKFVLLSDVILVQTLCSEIQWLQEAIS